MGILKEQGATGTLILTMLVIVASGGIALIIAFIRVVRIARRSGISAPDSYPCLVFGKRLHQGLPDTDYKMRLDRVSTLLENDQGRLVIILGGRTSSDQMSEAYAGLEYLKSTGLGDHAVVVLEESSTNTLDNLRNARTLLSLSDQDPLVLISNSYHMARCSQIASSLGLEHVLCAAEESYKLESVRCLSEALFLLWFQIGKGWALLTSNKRQLERIT